MPNDRPHARVSISYQRGTLRICLVLLLLTVNDVINLESATQRENGAYVENGPAETAIDTTTPNQKLAVEREILKFLGIRGKPDGKINQALLMKQSSAKFMLDVYAMKAKKPNERVEPSEFGFTENDLRLIEQSDFIIPFKAHQIRQKAGGNPDRDEILWFHITTIPAGNQVISAQLRLYRGPSPKNSNNHGAFTVTAYQVMRTIDGQTQMQLVDSANTIAGHEGWITLNVTTSLRHWIEHPGDDRGLYLSVHPVDSSSHKTTPNDIGIVLFEDDAERQPFMVGFFRMTKSDTL